MMRVFLLFLVIVAAVYAQRPFNQGGPGGGRFPGGQLTSPIGGSRGCFCLPPNQVCKPNGPIPVGATRISISTRVVNLSPQQLCAQGDKECCFGSKGTFPSPPIGQPVPVTGCGVPTRLIPGSAFADEAEFGEYPWMAAILKQNNKYVAGGVLVSPTTVLTAAHKVTEPGDLKVRLGDHDLGTPNEFPQYPHREVSVSQVILHTQFNPQNLENDIAILKLASPVRFTQNILPACLPEASQRFTGDRCYVSGWGQDLNGQFQRVMKEVDLPIVDETECEDRLRKTRLTSSFILDKRSFLCAGGEFGKDTCKGDGGSPLVCKEGDSVFTVVGLVSWGIGCGDNDVPGVYVNVATYISFINQHLQ